MRPQRSNLITLTILLMLAAPSLWSQTTVSKPEAGASAPTPDHFAAAGKVTVTTPVAGDLIAAGGDIDVSANVRGDAVVAGGNVRVGAPVQQGIYAAGGRVLIDAPVQRNARIAGGNVELGPQAKIAGNASIGGGEVVVRGAIDGYVEIGGGRVYLNGPIGGDVEIGGGDIELGPEARINGKLRYASRREIRRDAAAQVRGGVERIDVPLSARRRLGRVAGWVWTVGLAIIAAVLVGTLPRVFANVSDTARTRWPLSLLVGFVALACIPVAALIVLITVIGIPLALAMIALYFALLLMGYVAAGIAAGDLALRRWQQARATQIGWRVVAAMFGMLAISLLGRIPFIGGLVVLAAMLIGMGALLTHVRSQIRATAR